jgi:glycosyltransferase involved in cell wall biosynthesis
MKASPASDSSNPSSPFTPSAPSIPKVLIITYYWPPGSGAGVQRWLKFSKYLPSNGWEPVILTVDPEYATYPAIDHSLEKDIPAGLRVIRTRALDWFRLYKRNKSEIPSAGFAANNNRSFSGRFSRFIRGNFFIPDPRRGWNRFAFRKACEIISGEGIVNFITTSPPHSTQLIGLRLKRKLPAARWIADLRDPWTGIYYYKEFYLGFISRMIDLGYERKVLRSADRIITVGDSLKEHFAERVPEASVKTEVIFNGYDGDDFAGLTPVKPSRFTISYIGTLSPAYPLDAFLVALSELKAAGRDPFLRFVGMVPEELKAVISGRTGSENTEFHGYASHREAIRYMLDSSALLLIIPDHETNRSIITGKLFEYLAAKVPVICLGPVDGDAARILADCGSGRVFGYGDAAGIQSFIEEIMSGASAGNLKPPEEFRRDNLTRKIARLFEEPVNKRPG